MSRRTCVSKIELVLPIVELSEVAFLVGEVVVDVVVVILNM